MIPYCICIFDGNNKYSYYLSDFKDSSVMIQSALRIILSKKYNGYIIYAHNFSKFDGIFILKILTKLATTLKLNIDIIKRDNDFINIIIKGDDFECNFRD